MHLTKQLAHLHAHATAGLRTVLIVAASALTACAGAPGQEDVGAAQQKALGMNGLPPIDLADNGLTTSAPVTRALLANELTVDGVLANAAAAEILDDDAASRVFFKYVVSCALPAGRSLVFPRLADQDEYTFPGGFGLAPAWGAEGGSCDASCQQWVSACVIARENALGQHVPLSVRGESPALALARGEATAYPHREATYFGDVFSSPQQIFGCRAPEDDQTLIGRPCGDGADVSGCLVDVLPSCHTTCRELDPTSGAFSDCRAPSGVTFDAAVTIYRM